MKKGVKKTNVIETTEHYEIYFGGIKIIYFEKDELLGSIEGETYGYKYSILNVETEEYWQMKATSPHMLRWLIGASERELKTFWIAQMTSWNKEFDKLLENVG